MGALGGGEHWLGLKETHWRGHHLVMSSEAVEFAPCPAPGWLLWRPPHLADSEPLPRGQRVEKEIGRKSCQEKSNERVFI